MPSVQVWRVDLDQPPPAVTALATVLDEDERAAAAKRVGSVRDRYVVAHGALRTVLAHVAGGAAGALVLDRTCGHCGDPRHGRPTLAGSDVEFNLSHSDGIALIACTHAVRVGVDVEVVRPRSLLPKLARRVLDEESYEAWLARPEAEQLGVFIQEWTAREAYLKGVGLGIVRRLRDVPASPPGWTITALPVGELARASLAVEHPDPPGVRLATWSLAGTGTLER
ncbi:MAG TPA: 4'-phosphopantetheinyl transferase superfamily protein [Acidimicrobiia bacterium]|nr:4'-phosphopantetheinyl transferase superfamily protein [Acidimicrobiia bacterium]